MKFALKSGIIWNTRVFCRADLLFLCNWIVCHAYFQDLADNDMACLSYICRSWIYTQILPIRKGSHLIFKCTLGFLTGSNYLYASCWGKSPGQYYFRSLLFLSLRVGKILAWFLLAILQIFILASCPTKLWFCLWRDTKIWMLETWLQGEDIRGTHWSQTCCKNILKLQSARNDILKKWPIIWFIVPCDNEPSLNCKHRHWLF